MDLTGLLDAVEGAFTRTGTSTPSWPDPHAGRPPRDEEYARCLHPERYGIVVARAEAWVQALVGLGLATEQPLGTRAGPGGSPLRTQRRRTAAGCSRAGRALLAVTGVDRAPRSAVVLGAGRPARQRAQVPSCGCDACDHGSDDLLAQLDEAVLDVVSAGRSSSRSVCWEPFPGPGPVGGRP